MAQIYPGVRNPTDIQVGTIDVGTTPTQGPDVKVAPGLPVSSVAAADNTASIWIGKSTQVENLNILYFVASIANQKINYICEVP